MDWPCGRLGLRGWEEGGMMVMEEEEFGVVGG